MRRYSDLTGGQRVLPQLERLEERLLLTTLHGGEFFIYQNSKLG